MSEERIMANDGDFDEKICIIRDIYERHQPKCEKCPLRAVCGDRSLTEEQIDRVLIAVQRGMYIRIDHMESRMIPVDPDERGFRTEYD